MAKRGPKGDFVYHAGGQLYMPDRKITRVKSPSRYCRLPLRGYGHIQAVLHKGRHRAIGFNYGDVLATMGVHECNPGGLSGARRRKRRR